MPKEGKSTKKERKDTLRALNNNGSPGGKVGLIVGGLFVVGLIAAFWGLYTLSGNTQNSDKPKESSLGEFVAAPAPPNDHIHVQPGEAHVPYTSNPPSSGPHYNGSGLGPIACRAYDKPITDEGVVHNLEHGQVWISYKEENDKDLTSKLDALTSQFPRLVVSPRPADDAPIAAVAWERVMKLQSYDEQKLVDFIKLYTDQKGLQEQFGECG